VRIAAGRVSINSFPAGDAAYRIDGLTSHDGRFTVALDRVVAHPANHPVPGGVATVTRGAGGSWTAPKRLAHTHNTDSELRVLANPANAELIAAFVRRAPKSGQSGVMAQTEDGTTWHDPSYLARDTGDIISQLSIDKAAHAIVGYFHDA
jgi:hypothetical protein